MLHFRPLALGLTLALAATLATAQTYPSQSETAVTDDAEMLSPVQEAELAERLAEIEQQGNVDFAVVTLISTALYTAGDDNDVYAQGLIRNWEMGATTGGRAVLLLIFRDDSEMVVEFGPGFDGSQTAPIQPIIDDEILPLFEQSNLVGGLNAGVEAINARIISPQPATTPDTTADGTGEGGGNALYWIGGGIAAIAALIFGANRRAAAKLAATPCPSCGKTGLTRERVTLNEATTTHEGTGEVRTNCANCGHVTAESFTIPKKDAPNPKDNKPGTGGSGSW